MLPEEKKHDDLHIIRLALVKMSCNSCQEQVCEGCPLEQYRVCKSYFKEKGDSDVL